MLRRLLIEKIVPESEKEDMSVKGQIVVPKGFEGIKKSILEDEDYYDFEKFSYLQNWKLRESFRKSVSWHIPTRMLLKTLVEYSPLVSVGSGYAFTESKASEVGADIFATDISPDAENKWCKDGKFFMPVEMLDAIEAVKKYKDRNVFLAWPPYDTSMASQVAKEMEIGRMLIYVGEPNGGCTANDDFFDFISENFEEAVNCPKIYSFWGIHDFVFIYKKITNKK